MNLKHLTNDTLLADTKNLAGRERELTSQILHHLKEIDSRKLYCDLGYSSLYAYCRFELGYSEGSAQRRIDGARILVHIPEIGLKIESGELTLGALGKAASFFREQGTKSVEEKIEVIDQLSHMSQKDCEKRLIELSGEDKPAPKEKAKRFKTDQTHVSMNLSDETLEKLAKLKSLMGTKMSQDELMAFMAEAAIQKVEKEKFKQTDKPRNTTTVAANKRHISAVVKREVYLRDKNCTNCGTTHNLNFDHIQPFSFGGKSSTENIRLLCFNCNQRGRMGFSSRTFAPGCG
jgi:hypothetical protein